MGFELCFENKLQKETFGCFPLLGILKAAARRYSCLSLTLGKRSCLISNWTTIFSKNVQLPFLIFPKPDNKLYTGKVLILKLNSCDVTLERHNKGPHKSSSFQPIWYVQLNWKRCYPTYHPSEVWQKNSLAYCLSVAHDVNYEAIMLKV